MNDSIESISFHALFEHSSIGIIIIDSSGSMLKVNPFAAKIFGYEPSELINQKIEVLLPEGLRKNHVELRNSYCKNPVPREMGSGIDLRALRKSGELFDVEISLSFYEVNNQLNVISFINDITERKKNRDKLKNQAVELEKQIQIRTNELFETNKNLESEIERRKKSESQVRKALLREKELNELKTRFVSMASHEFRTPLGGILTSASLIEKYKTSETEDKRKKHVDTIKKSVRNLTSILNDFLSLDKLEEGRFGFNPVKFDLEEFIGTVCKELQENSSYKNQLLYTHHGRKLEVVQDQEMLRNIINNLFSNASKYSPSNEKVDIITEDVGGSFNLIVKDNGIGIPEKDQKHLFERFFRASNVTSIQGTGLGLNIVNRYLEMMGGTISFDSNVGKGTTFTLTIPVEKKNEKNFID